MRWRHERSHDGLFAHFSPDGKTVATCNRSIRLWNVADGKLLREIGGDHSQTWDHPVFSPDGKWLAAYVNRQLAASVDRQLVLVDVATGTPRQVLLTNDDISRVGVNLVGFSPDGKPFAVGWSNDDIYLFDFPDDRRLRKVHKAIKSWIASALTADGKTLLALSTDRKIGLWDTRTGALIRVVDLDLKALNSGAWTRILFSPDGTTVAIKADAPEPLVVFDTATGKELFRLKGEAEASPPFAYSPDGKTLLAKFRAEGETISLWDTKTGQRKRRLNIPADSGNYFEISPDGKTLLAADAGPTVRLWDMDTGQRLTVQQGHENTIFHAVVTPDSKTLISGSRDGQILVWDLASSRVRRELQPALEELSGLTLRPRTDEAVSWTWDGIIRFHNWQTGQESRRIHINELFDKKEPSNKGSRRFLYGLKCSPDGSQALIFIGQIPGAPPCS
jgi:WD40 repeat protein